MVLKEKNQVFHNTISDVHKSSSMEKNTVLKPSDVILIILAKQY